ncbi:CHC2 zinc finger domain-containing protein [Kitasatospora sp. NPDC058218]|uniref:CHC2 zinc finger domain-containing protein n=1 Tax=Kitasatospora sp. NPDC058218 TaxID=3346385 RepID=UPI0036D85A2D
MTLSPKPPISEVLRHYYGIQLRERGGWQKILCPLHPEENPSASANTEKQRWSCFVCDVTEDSYDVIQREKGCGFREAQEFARERFGGGGEELLWPVRRQPGRGLHGRPRFGAGGDEVRDRLRRFGSHWS